MYPYDFRKYQPSSSCTLQTKPTEAPYISHIDPFSNKQRKLSNKQGKAKMQQH